MLDVDPLRDGPPPAPAATVVLVRQGSRGPEVLLVQRHRATAFMGGAFVFPGGRVEAADASPEWTAVSAGLDDAAERLGEPGTGDAARALFVAAIREKLEEAGVLLGTFDGDVAAMRAAMAAGEPFGTAAGSRGVRLDAARLVPFARWITPAVERKRFDTRFFAARVDASEIATHDAHETVASMWISPEAAVEKHLAGAIDLPPPTLRTLELFSGLGSAQAVIDRAGASPPPLVRPVFRDLDGSWILALPGDPEHPEKTPVLGGTRRFVCRDTRWYSE